MQNKMNKEKTRKEIMKNGSPEEIAYLAFSDSGIKPMNKKIKCKKCGIVIIDRMLSYEDDFCSKSCFEYYMKQKILNTKKLTENIHYQEGYIAGANHYKQDVIHLITKEIVTAQLEGQSTSRLTSLFVKLKPK